jgi:four helix bundle protein
MQNNAPTLEVGRSIAERLAELACMAIKVACAIPNKPAYRHMIEQLAKAATGGGSNYEEARAAESRADFVHKLGIARKEVRETGYWLRLVRGAAIVSVPLLDRAIDETEQLSAILAASIRTARRDS